MITAAILMVLSGIAAVVFGLTGFAEGATWLARNVFVLCFIVVLIGLMRSGRGGGSLAM